MWRRFWRFQDGFDRLQSVFLNRFQGYLIEYAGEIFVETRDSVDYVSLADDDRR